MRIGSKPLVLWISSSAASAVSAFRHVSSKTSAASWLALAFTSPRCYSHSTSTKLAAMKMSSSSTDSLLPSKLRVALCQFPVTPHKVVNEQIAKSYLQRAKDQGAQLAVLPEIWNSPYATAAFPDYAEVLPDMGDSTAQHSSASQLLMDAAKEHGMWIVGGSIPERVPQKDSKAEKEEIIYNTCLVLDPQGTVVAKHRKVHLFDIDVPGGITFFESETLTAGSTVSHFSTPFGEIGVGICYDIRFAEYAMVLRQQYNCVLLIYPGAFNMTTGPAHWELLQRARAMDNQCFVLTASPARTTAKDDNDTTVEDGKSSSKYPHYIAWGHSTIVSPWGDVVATTDENEGLVVADLDLSRVQEVRSGIPIGKQRRTDLYSLEDLSQK